jgi:PKD repeat protein
VRSSVVTVIEGEPAENSGTVDDPGDDVVTLTASVGTVTDNGDGTWSWGFLTSDGPAESQTVTITATDDDASTLMNFDLVVSNVAPTVGPITASYDPVSVGTPINASAGFTDPGPADTHTAQWDWNWDHGDNGTGTVTQGTGSGSVNDAHTYTEAGLYEIQLTVTDDDGDSDEEVFEYVVVFDPSGGFVTGGGWIHSEQGAYVPDPSLEGKATFGFVSKYKKGTTVPTGQTEFRFRVADLNFHSSSYDWLVVTGSDYAKFKGSGTINGMGDYKFMLWAGDGSPDTFRIRIWEEDESTDAEAVIYDNGFEQAIGGGSIVVHSK